MSEESSVDVLLTEILEDFQNSLRAAKNVAAKRKLRDRIDRVERAIAQNERSPSSNRMIEQLPRPAND
jgi:hypothetical protein